MDKDIDYKIRLIERPQPGMDAREYNLFDFILEVDGEIFRNIVTYRVKDTPKKMKRLLIARILRQVSEEMGV